MSDISNSPETGVPPMRTKSSLMTETPRNRQRNAAEKRFRVYGIIAVAIALTT
ncbi:MAG: hypothetical protein RL128_1923, partial [Pseudomonadota bacterium]